MNLSRTLSFTCAALLLAAGMAQAKPQVIVTGTVKYDPAKTFNSYVIMATKGTTKLIDRNGNLIKEWDSKSTEYSMPAKALPGGYVAMTLYPSLPTGGQDANTLAILDFDGNVVRKFNHHEKVDDIGCQGRNLGRPSASRFSDRGHEHGLLRSRSDAQAGRQDAGPLP